MTRELQFGKSSINLGVRYWVPTKRYRQTAYAVNGAIHRTLTEAGIAIPFPQRDVRLISAPSTSGVVQS